MKLPSGSLISRAGRAPPPRGGAIIELIIMSCCCCCSSSSSASCCCCFDFLAVTHFARRKLSASLGFDFGLRIPNEIRVWPPSLPLSVTVKMATIVKDREGENESELVLAEQSKGAEEESMSASEKQKLKRNSEQRFAIGEKKSKASDPAK